MSHRDVSSEMFQTEYNRRSGKVKVRFLLRVSEETQSVRINARIFSSHIKVLYPFFVGVL
jgi:hypothetical protein